MKKHLVILLLLFVSCSQNTLNKCIVNDDTVKINRSEIPISSIIQIKNMIPLETTDASLLGRIEKVVRDEERIYIKSANKPLIVFNDNGKFLETIGSLGSGPEEYSVFLDFDICEDLIYILTVNKIQIFAKEGAFLKSIPILVNASGFRVIGDKILLFVLGNSYVVHVLDMNGKLLDRELERNQALRLSKAIPFVRYGEGHLLFSQGRSNDILAYNIHTGAFEKMSYLSSSDNLSASKEALLMESEKRNSTAFKNNGKTFDGLTSSDTHTLFGSIDGDDIVVWIKDVRKGDVKAYALSSLTDDLTFTSSDFFIKENTDGGDLFLSYLMPYLLLEGLENNRVHSDSPNYEQISLMLDSLNVEEANPVIIEYSFK